MTVDGRAAIRISSPPGGPGDEQFLVDAATYDPISWSETTDGVTLSASYRVFERLPASSTEPSLFDLAAQHPGAAVDDDPADYAAAAARAVNA